MWPSIGAKTIKQLEAQGSDHDTLIVRLLEELLVYKYII
jgi:hypothetical protein